MGGRVVIVGPGRMGLALGAALVRAGHAEAITFMGRGREPPPHPLFELGDHAVGYMAGPVRPPEDTSVLILAVPDAALPATANELALAGAAPPGCVAFHLAGAISTEVLSPLHAAGYAVGSLHPLQTVADPWAAGERLFGAAYALAGEPAAVAVGRRIIDALRGRAIVVPPALRPVYHAGAVIASNFLVTLIAYAARQLQATGLSEREALEALLPLLRGTIDNIEHLGLSMALTGPIARGDADTVRLHLARLSPEDRSLYCRLGRETLRIAVAAGLDAELAAELESLLAVD
ncbi:MAG TPA: Rossmann-like and DUF2520 domain-containing protein [Longimicrobiales bacterium]|nr:Rossmann-like and DUF2520 domain-containing protein [Longimicrobiales bacterium]